MAFTCKHDKCHTTLPHSPPLLLHQQAQKPHLPYIHVHPSTVLHTPTWHTAPYMGKYRTCPDTET